MRIVIDTREQAPWHFPEWCAEVVWRKLDAGDYALDGDHFFAIERKSLGDFIGTIGAGWERFKAELSRMRRHVARIVIVEGDFASTAYRELDGVVEPPEHCHGRMAPAFVASRIAELTLDGVSVLFAGDAELAAGLAYRILYRRWRELEYGGKTD